MSPVATQIAIVLMLFPSPSQSQPLSFEVADVKINKSGELRMMADMLPGGKLTMRNVPMKVWSGPQF
jgi:hypothetical protein